MNNAHSFFFLTETTVSISNTEGKQEIKINPEVFPFLFSFTHKNDTSKTKPVIGSEWEDIFDVELNYVIRPSSGDKNITKIKTKECKLINKKDFPADYDPKILDGKTCFYFFDTNIYETH